MTDSFLRVFDTPDPDEQAFCRQLGLIGRLMATAPTHREAPVGYLASLVIPAIHHKQTQVFFDEDGAPVGYVIWARLAEDVQRRVMTSGTFKLHESEWNEGEQLWVLDFLAAGGHLKYVLRHLRDHAFGDDATVRYLRVKGRRRMIKEIARNERLSFFSREAS
jgi:hemolysin-activating ACP:hemolysin acyltransferase